MKIVYTPAGNPDAAEEFTVDINTLWVGEVKLLEKVLNQTIVEIGDGIGRGSFTHMMALIWIFRRRTDRELRIDDIDDQIRMSELKPVEEDEDLDDAPKDEEPSADSQTGANPEA